MFVESSLYKNKILLDRYKPNKQNKVQKGFQVEFFLTQWKRGSTFSLISSFRNLMTNLKKDTWMVFNELQDLG